MGQGGRVLGRESGISASALCSVWLAVASVLCGTVDCARAQSIGAIEAEAQTQALCMQTEDFARAYRAFVNRSSPAFTGE